MQLWRIPGLLSLLLVLAVPMTQGGHAAADDTESGGRRADAPIRRILLSDSEGPSFERNALPALRIDKKHAVEFHKPFQMGDQALVLRAFGGTVRPKRAGIGVEVDGFLPSHDLAIGVYADPKHQGIGFHLTF